MHKIESFTVVSQILGSARKSTFDAIDGLTIKGLTESKARVLLQVMENLKPEIVAAVLNGEGIQVNPTDNPVMPTGAQNKARWEPAKPQPPLGNPTMLVKDGVAIDERLVRPVYERTERVDGQEITERWEGSAAEEAPSPVSEPQPTPTAAEEPETVPAAPEEPEPVTEAHTAPEEVSPSERVSRDMENEYLDDVPNTTPIPAAERHEEPAATDEAADDSSDPPDFDDVPSRPTVEEVIDETPTPTPRRNAKGKKAPPRVHELPVKFIKVGAKYGAIAVVEVKKQQDGGRLLILDNGDRVKLDKRANEVARVAGPPLDIEDDVVPATELAQPKEKDKLNGRGKIPQSILGTMRTREVLTFLVDQGFEDEDALIAEAFKLKELGAATFMQCKDEEAVIRRVKSTLVVMGRG